MSRDRSLTIEGAALQPTMTYEVAVERVASMLWIRGLGSKAGSTNAARAIVDALLESGHLILRDRGAHDE